MHIEPRLWTFTRGVRLRIAWTVLIGLVASGLGVARLGLLGWLIGALFAGREPRAACCCRSPPSPLVMVLRGVFEHWRAMVAHETAARVQMTLRRVDLRQDRRARPGRGRAPALRRAHAVADRRGRAARDLFRPVPAAVPDLPAVAGPDLRRHRLHRPAGRGGDAGVRADRPVRAGAVAQATTSRARWIARKPMPPSPPSSWIRSRAWRR